MYVQVNRKFCINQVPTCARTKMRKSSFFFFSSRITERASCPLASKSFSFSATIRAVRNKQTHLPPPAAAHQPAPAPAPCFLVPDPWSLRSEPPAAAALPSAFGSKVVRRAGGAGPRVEVGMGMGVEVEGSKRGTNRQTQ